MNKALQIWQLGRESGGQLKRGFPIGRHGTVARSEGRDATFMYILLGQNLNGSYLVVVICFELHST